MKNANYAKGIFVAMLLFAAPLSSGCGGRSGGGVAAQPPANPADRGTLKLTNAPAKTVITIDGQQQPVASGTITIQLAPGVHSVVVSRTGYTVTNSADLANTPVAINQTTEKALSFAREEIPLPDDWAEAAARIAGAPKEDKPAPPPAP